MPVNWEYVLVGFIVGACTAYSGVGAGAITTPLLIFLGSVPIKRSAPICSSRWGRVRDGNAHSEGHRTGIGAWRLSIGGLPGAIIGVIVSARLHQTLNIHQLEHVLRIAVAVALLVSAAGIIFNRKLAGDASSADTLPTFRLALIGFFVGLTVSITSIGAGSLTLPLLLLVAPVVALRRLVGTDLAFAVVVLVPSLLGHWRIGDVNPSIAGSLLVGSIPGVFVGAYLVTRLPERWFRGALAGVLVVVALALLPILPHPKG